MMEDKSINHISNDYEFIYARKHKDDGYKPYDLKIRHKDNTCEVKIEIEIGELQDDWDTELPNKYRWPYGLSIPKRKDDYNRYDLYVKFSKSLKSFFAFDYNSIRKYGVTDVKRPNLAQKSFRNNDFVSMSFTYLTNDGITNAYDDYAILWKLILNYLTKGKNENYK